MCLFVFLRLFVRSLVCLFVAFKGGAGTRGGAGGEAKMKAAGQPKTRCAGGRLAPRLSRPVAADPAGEDPALVHPEGGRLLGLPPDATT